MFLDSIISSFTSVMWFVLGLSVLVIVHEFGHFIAAKMLGIRVEGFSLFFGQPILAWRKAKSGGWRFRSFNGAWGAPESAFAGDETEYAIRWIPFGGYVKMSGQSDFGEADTKGEPWEYTSKPTWARAIVIAAGPFMNFVLAVAFFAWLNMSYGTVGRIGIGPAPEMRVSAVRAGSPAERAGVAPGSRWVAVNGVPLTTWEDLGEQLERESNAPTLALATPGGDTIRITAAPGLENLEELGIEWEALPVVGTLVPLEPASEAGLRVGDRVVAVNGTPVATWDGMSRIIRRHAGKPVGIDVERAGFRETLVVEPAVDIATDGNGDGVRLGIVPAIGTAFAQTWIVTVKLVRFLERLITGVISPKYLAGPIGIFKMTGAAAEQGTATFVAFLALLSAQLGFFNLIPIALLDGGHLVFLAFEGVTGRRPSARQQGVIQQVGVVLLLSLMIMVTIIDLGRFF